MRPGGRCSGAGRQPAACGLSMAAGGSCRGRRSTVAPRAVEAVVRTTGQGTLMHAHVPTFRPGRPRAGVPPIRIRWRCGKPRASELHGEGGRRRAWVMLKGKAPGEALPLWHHGSAAARSHAAWGTTAGQRAVRRALPVSSIDSRRAGALGAATEARISTREAARPCEVLSGLRCLSPSSYEGLDPSARIKADVLSTAVNGGWPG